MPPSAWQRVPGAEAQDTKVYRSGLSQSRVALDRRGQLQMEAPHFLARLLQLLQPVTRVAESLVMALGAG